MAERAERSWKGRSIRILFWMVVVAAAELGLMRGASPLTLMLSATLAHLEGDVLGCGLGHTDFDLVVL